MKKSHDQLLITFPAFISPITRKFISKIDRGVPKARFLKTFQNSFFVIASKNIENFLKKATMKDKYGRFDDSEKNGRKIPKIARDDSFLV